MKNRGLSRLLTASIVIVGSMLLAGCGGGGGDAPGTDTASDIITLPDTPASRQLSWILDQLAVSATPIAEIQAHFDPLTLNSTPASEWAARFDAWRSGYPDARIVEVITATPMRIDVVIGSPGARASGGAYLSLQTGYSGAALINLLEVSGVSLDSTITRAEDAGLSATQAADKLEMITPSASILIAQINDSYQCVPILDRGASIPRATASMVKIWLLGALALAVDDGSVDPQQQVALDPGELVPVGAIINDEPPGTPFSAQDMATLMMGVSDNSATDHVHELVGRTRAEAALTQFGHASPELMTPFLSVNEQFHLYWSVPEADALAYVLMSEADQRNYLDNVLVPLGPVTSFPYANASILVTGTWQASPMDVCTAIAGLRRLDGSKGFALLDAAYGASSGFIGVRNRWQRVWYKGGSFSDSQGLRVLTLGWLLESAGRGSFAVVVMVNGSVADPRIDSGAVSSIASRFLSIVDENY